MMKVLLTFIITIMMMNTCNGQQTVPTVRPATQAGRFYEANPQQLSEDVDSFLSLHAADQQYNDVAALIVPHAGYYFSGNVAAAAYSSLAKDKQFKRIFLLGPSHHAWLDGASVNGMVDYYATPLGQVKVDCETALQLMAADSIFSFRPQHTKASTAWKCNCLFCKDFSARRGYHPSCLSSSPPTTSRN